MIKLKYEIDSRDENILEKDLIEVVDRAIREAISSYTDISLTKSVKILSPNEDKYGNLIDNRRDKFVRKLKKRIHKVKTAQNLYDMGYNVKTISHYMHIKESTVLSLLNETI